MDFQSGVVGKVVTWFVALAFTTIYKVLNLSFIEEIKEKLGDLFSSKKSKELIKEKNGKTLNNIQIKLSNINSSQKLIIVGGVYLDITADPVQTQVLEKAELTGINSVTFSLGGSALFVGQYLYAKYKQKSYLFTTVGGIKEENSGNKNNSLIVKETNRQLELENWRTNPEDTQSIPGKDTATTIALIQKYNSYSTMLIHTGSLKHLTWDMVKKHLNKVTKKNNVIYFSGFLKTGLYENLDSNLRELSKKNIICIDHGRLDAENSNDVNSSLQSLRNVFEHKYVDIYICTFNEIFNYYNRVIDEKHKIKKKPKVNARKQTLKKIAKYGILPPITIVRGVGEDSYFEAYTIICKEVFKIETSENKPIELTSSKHKAIFNAVFLHDVIRNQDKGELKERIKSAVKEGLESCYEVVIFSDLQKENEKNRKNLDEMDIVIDDLKKRMSHKTLLKHLKKI